MSIKMKEQQLFFDSNCFVGGWNPLPPGVLPNAEWLLSAMDRLRIGDALVSHTDAVNYDERHGNSRLMEAIRGHQRLHPCWVASPLNFDEMPAEVQAVRVLPKRIGPLREYIYGPMMDAFAERNMLTLIDFDLDHWGSQMAGIDWDGLHWLLESYPKLPVLLLRVGHAVDRALLPFMQRHPNLYIETSYYIGAGALERLAGLFGPQRLVLGTGMPRYAPGPAITLLTYSGLDDEAKRLVGGENLRRLLNL